MNLHTTQAPTLKSSDQVVSHNLPQFAGLLRKSSDDP